jgi:predicted nucleotidyltransferase component of viral defense system
MPGNNDHIIAVARKLQTKVEAPVLGGIAVYLHGHQRATTDLDFYTADRTVTDEQLRDAGAIWDTGRREHVMEHVRIHTVTPEDAGHQVERVSQIDSVRVVSLKDLIAIKLICGLKNIHRGKDLVDVQELIRIVGLDKRFAGKLPKHLRADFKAMVDVVRAGERATENKRPF